MIWIASIIAFIYVFSRLSTLEQSIKKLNENVKAPISPMSSQPVQHAQPVQPHITFVTQPVRTVAPSIAMTSVLPNVPVVDEAKPQLTTNNVHSEFDIGSKLFTAVGVIALFIGIGFFLRYAFQKDLISESARIFLGVSIGAVIGVIGAVLRKKYASYGLALVGAGFGIVYISIYAAYAFYQLISIPTAMAFLVLVAACAIFAAVRLNSRSLANFSFVGAFLILFLIPISDSIHLLFSYLIVLNISILLIARFKAWPHLTVGGLIATFLIAQFWIGTPASASYELETYAYLAIIFFTYFMTSIINFLKREADYHGIDGILLYGVPVLYFILNTQLTHSQDQVALLAVIIASINALVAIGVKAFNAEGVPSTKVLFNALILISSAFAVLATILHFNNTTLSIYLALEAIVLVVMGYFLDTRSTRVFGIFIALISAFHVLVYDLSINSGDVVIFNKRALVCLILFATYFIIWVIYHMQGQDSTLDDGEKSTALTIGGCGIALIPFVWMTLEVTHFIDIKPLLYLPLFWIFYAALLMHFSFIAKQFMFRAFSYVLVGITGLLTMGVYWHLPTEFYTPLINIRVLGSLFIVLVLIELQWLMRRNQDQLSKEESSSNYFFIFIPSLLILWVMTLEILDYFNNIIDAIISEHKGEGYSYFENTKRVVLSLAWLIYAAIGLTIGIVWRSYAARVMSIVLFAVVVGKVFLYDTANLSDIYRFVSYISLGVILLLAGFAYYRFKERITNFVSLKSNTDGVV